MKPLIQQFIHRPNIFRLGINLWLPYLGAGIRVDRISPDWREIDVSMHQRWYNRNYMGTHFGGSLYAMTDPFYVLMLIQNLGPNYWVWDLEARIRFVSPGRGTVRAQFRLPGAVIEQIRFAAAGGGKILENFESAVLDLGGDIVAEVIKTVYVRLKKSAPKGP